MGCLKKDIDLRLLFLVLSVLLIFVVSSIYFLLSLNNMQNNYDEKVARLEEIETQLILQDKRLRECNYGDFNGKSSYIVEPLQEANIIKKFPNGESYEDVKERINEFLDFLKKNYADQEIAIVGHKAPQLALDVIIRNKTWKQAFHEDWRKKKAWQPGWEYSI